MNNHEHGIRLGELHVWGSRSGTGRTSMTNGDAGKIYITVRAKNNEITRLLAPNTEYAHALANVLNDLGHRASHVPATCGIYFSRDPEELAREELLLQEVVNAKGGLSIVDLRS